MDGQERASVIGYTTLAVEDLKAALKDAKKGATDADVGFAVQRACERLREVLTITGVQLHFSPGGREAEADDDEDVDDGPLFRSSVPATGRPLLTEGTPMPHFEAPPVPDGEVN